MVTVLPRSPHRPREDWRRRSASVVATRSAQRFAPQAVGSAGDIDDVFDSDRNPVQRTAIVAGLQLVVQRSRLFERPVAIEHDPGVDLRFPFVDLFEAALENLDAGSSPLRGVRGRRRRSSGRCLGKSRGYSEGDFDMNILA